MGRGGEGSARLVVVFRVMGVVCVGVLSRVGGGGDGSACFLEVCDVSGVFDVVVS